MLLLDFYIILYCYSMLRLIDQTIISDSKIIKIYLGFMILNLLKIQQKVKHNLAISIKDNCSL